MTETMTEARRPSTTLWRAASVAAVLAGALAVSGCAGSGFADASGESFKKEQRGKEDNK